MNKEIILCDQEAAYVSALLSYLIRKFPDVRIKTFTEQLLFEGFLSQGEQSSCECLIMGKEFIDIYEKYQNRLRAKRIFQFCKESEETNYEPLYKFQSTEQLMMKILKDMEFKNNKEKAIEIYYSPVNKDVVFPVAMKSAVESGGTVLVVDFEEIDYARMLLGLESKYSMMDVLYYVAQSEKDSLRAIGDFAINYEGIDIVTPPSNPIELSMITESDLKNLFSFILESDYQKVILVVQNLNEIIRQIVKENAQMTIIYSNESYASQIVNYIEKVMDLSNINKLEIDIKRAEKMLEFGFDSFSAGLDMERMA